MPNKRCQVILIAGPTASGKSRLAQEIAKRKGGTIVNSDALQIYQGLEILTASPTQEEKKEVPHFLYNTMPPSQASSVVQWGEALQATDLIRERGDGEGPLLFVGGTGLYFKILLEGISPLPPVDPLIRSEWRRVAEETPQSLHAALAQRDPVLAVRLAPNDRHRLVRGLEVFDSTGVPLSTWQRVPGRPLLSESLRASAVGVVLDPPRPWAQKRSANRLATMLQAGVLEEVTFFLQQKGAASFPATKAIGFKPLQKFLEGEYGWEVAEERFLIDTRRYAKRQRTWFRHQMPHWIRFCPSSENDESLADAVMRQIGLL